VSELRQKASPTTGWKEVLHTQWNGNWGWGGGRMMPCGSQNRTCQRFEGANQMTAMNHIASTVLEDSCDDQWLALCFTTLQ
jgi:hypothetical protein